MPKRKKEQTTTKAEQVSDTASISPKNNHSKKAEPQSMEELLKTEGYAMRVLKRGDEVKGTVISVSPKQVLINVGGKSYGAVSNREMVSLRDLVSKLTPGEEVTASVLIPEDEYGQIVLSLRKSSMEKRWQILKSALENDHEIEVIGIDGVKGGLLVDYAGIRGFIPASQLDTAFSDNPVQLKNRKLHVRILELDQVSNRFVVSQKAVTQKDLVESQQKALASINDGDTLTAKISGIVPFGAFAQVTIAQKEAEPITIEGLIHISEIAWERVESPNAHLKAGDDVKVKVIGKDDASGKLNLSLKQLALDPWAKVGKTYAKDQTVKGTVVRISHFGIFVRLEPGIEGLIHVSKMPVDYAPKVGDAVEAMIESIDLEKRKMGLSVVTHEKPIGYR